MPLFIQGLVCLCNKQIVLFIRRQIDYLIRNNRIGLIRLIHHTVRCFDQTVFIDSCIRRKRINQTDVRSFRRLNRAHSSVVRIMDISNLKSRTVSGKSSGSKGGKSSLMGKLGQRVILIHELGKLGGTEELLHSSRYRLDINQRLGCNLINILGGHSLTNHSFHTGKADSILVL